MGKQIAVVDVKVKKPFDVGEFITNILLEGGSIRIIEVLNQWTCFSGVCEVCNTGVL